jgi:hypothetical protein
LRVIKQTLLWATGAVVTLALLFGAVIVWPDPLFAFSLASGKITVFSNHPIPPPAENGFSMTARDCWIGLHSKLMGANIAFTLPMRTGDTACSFGRTPNLGASPMVWQHCFPERRRFRDRPCSALGLCRHPAAHTRLSLRTRAHPYRCLATCRFGALSRAQMGMGGLC